MHIADLNECLEELPEISVLEYFRSRPAGARFRWTGKDAVDADSKDFVGPIFVDDRAVEYVVHRTLGAPAREAKVSRVTRPNGTTRLQDMTCSDDISHDVRKALLAFVADAAALKKAG